MRPALNPRGQATTEVALGVLVLVPIILFGIFFAEATAFSLEATEAASEAMWDATAYQQQSYTGAFNRTPAAVGAATGLANGRQRARQLVFTSASPAAIQCSAGTGLGLSIAPTAGVYQDNGGMSCRASVDVDERAMARRFVDQGSGGLFQEPLSNALRAFHFCAPADCNQRFEMAVGDWGLTNLGGEDQECRLTMGGCANDGFFRKAQSVYTSHQTASRQRAYLTLVSNVVQTVPANFAAVTEFQMSYRGEESGFTERVPVIEGDAEWKTSPILGAWGASYGARAEGFLGR